MVLAWVTAQPIDMGRVMAGVGSPQDGAVLVFTGTVRRQNEGRAVTGIRYDAYQGMAERVLRSIADEAAARWDISRLAVAHRVGELEVGEVSVAIAVSSPHRAESFEAGRYIIEEIKQRLPVWKQERYADGQEQWLDGVRPLESRHE